MKFTSTKAIVFSDQWETSASRNRKEKSLLFCLSRACRHAPVKPIAPVPHLIQRSPGGAGQESHTTMSHVSDTNHVTIEVSSYLTKKIQPIPETITCFPALRSCCTSLMFTFWGSRSLFWSPAFRDTFPNFHLGIDGGHSSLRNHQCRRTLCGLPRAPLHTRLWVLMCGPSWRVLPHSTRPRWQWQ